MLTRKPRPVTTILSSFSSMVEELNRRSAASIAQAEAQDGIINTAVTTRDEALAESQRALNAAAKIGALVDSE